MTYKITNFLKHAEKDDYIEGCDPATSRVDTLFYKFEAENKLELINKLMEYFGVDRKAIKLDACEEAGRIDIQLMEDRNCFRADEAALNIWRRGKLELWLVTYSGYLERVHPEAWINGQELIFKMEQDT